MFDIVTIEPDDETVKKALKTVQDGNNIVSAPKAGYRYTALNATAMSGDGGTATKVLVVIGHAGPDTLSGETSWSNYVKKVTATVDPGWRDDKTTVYLVACSTAATGTKFAYKNISDEVKAQFPNATVWASSTVVSATDLSGDWEKI